MKLKKPTLTEDVLAFAEGDSKAEATDRNQGCVQESRSEGKTAVAIRASA